MSKEIKTLNGNIDFKPEALVNEKKPVNEFYMPSGVPGTAGFGTFTSMDHQLHTKDTGSFETSNQVNANEFADSYKKPVNKFGINQVSNNNAADGETPLSPTSNYNDDFRYADMNVGKNISSVDMVLQLMKVEKPTEDLVNQIIAGLDYELGHMTKRDKYQAQVMTARNLQKDPKYYDHLDNIIVGDGEEGSGKVKPDDDYEDINVNADVETWWPIGQGKPNGYQEPENIKENSERADFFPSPEKQLEKQPSEHGETPLFLPYQKPVKGGKKPFIIMDPWADYGGAPHGVNEAEEEPEEPKDTSHFMKHFDELDPEVKADILKKKAEKPQTTFFKKYPHATQHSKIAKSHEGPTRRPPTDPFWDKPEGEIDEIAADGAPGGFGGTLNYTTNWQTPNYFTTNQVSKFKNSPTDGEDDENSHIIPQDPGGQLEDNGYEEYVNSVERPPYTSNLEEAEGDIPIHKKYTEPPPEVSKDKSGYEGGHVEGPFGIWKPTPEHPERIMLPIKKIHIGKNEGTKMDEMWSDSNSTPVSSGWPVNRYFHGKLSKKGKKSFDRTANVVEEKMPERIQQRSLNEMINDIHGTCKEVGSTMINADLYAQSVMNKIENLLGESMNEKEIVVENRRKALEILLKEEDEIFFERAIIEMIPLNQTTLAENRRKIYNEIKNKGNAYKRLQEIMDEASIMGTPEQNKKHMYFKDGRWAVKYDEARWDPSFQEGDPLPTFEPKGETASEYIIRKMKEKSGPSKKIKVSFGREIPHKFEVDPEKEVPIKYKKDEIVGDEQAIGNPDLKEISTRENEPEGTPGSIDPETGIWVADWIKNKEKQLPELPPMPKSKHGIKKDYLGPADPSVNEDRRINEAFKKFADIAKRSKIFG